ncbi:hypothetical protein [Pelagicoccus mobilis]|uniref:Methyl-accepting transducer domain-containing protein n=1 Tax=Pelagicoccus mobilis TaxID=415221 RepID=A0A934VLY7_9BACT|nr:hypothetical protein [Pelagicoccus mobilis]MBK1878271.1 hypothetical protein [Pelagicoccus mobilis]
MKFPAIVRNLRKTFVRKLRKKDASQLGSSLSRTINLESQLTRSSKVFEQHFLKVLNTLEELQTAGSELSSQSSNMLALSQSEQNPINSVSRKLAPNLEFIERSAHEIDSLVKIMETNRHKIDETLSFESRLDQTFSQLTYIRTLFAVEAAPLEQNAKVMFTSLVEEIHRLQNDVTEIFAENFQALRENRGTIGGLASSLAKQASSQISIHAQSQREMERAIQTQTEKLTQDIEANSAFKNESDKIAQSIGTAIISLQTQDIISQKLQHIFEVSGEMRARFDKLTSIKGKRERCIEFRFLENAALVILNQIVSIKRELKDADRAIDESIQNIIHSIRGMDNTSGLLQDTAAEDSDGESLIAALQSAGTMVSTSESFLTQAFKTIEPIRSQTTNVSSTIVMLSSQLHLIGLNAEIHAARTGESTALETLSAKTSGISVETRDLCQNISVQLDELSSALLENVNVLESLLGEARKAHEHIHSEIPKETENLHHQSQLYRDCQTETQQLMQELHRLTRGHESRLEFEATMLQELDAMQSAHSEISQLAKRSADALKIEVSVPEIMSGLLSHYTMKSEQNVHMQTLGLEQQNEPAPSDFEMFERESSSPDEDLGFDDFGFEPERQTETKPKQDEELGQNVELF